MQRPTVIASSRMKTVLSALTQRHLHLCIKQTMDQSYLEPSHVLRETWADPYPVILPHYTWINGVNAGLGLM